MTTPNDAKPDLEGLKAGKPCKPHHVFYCATCLLEANERLEAQLAEAREAKIEYIAPFSNRYVAEVLKRCDQAREQCDKLADVLRKALVESGCDGDLCMYQWHETARATLAALEKEQ